jgi:hypothetical protein
MYIYRMYCTHVAAVPSLQRGAAPLLQTRPLNGPPNGPPGPKPPRCGDRRPRPPRPPCPPWPPGLPRRNVPLAQAGSELSAQGGSSLGHVAKVYTVLEVWFTLEYLARVQNTRLWFKIGHFYIYSLVWFRIREYDLEHVNMI